VTELFRNDLTDSGLGFLFHVLLTNWNFVCYCQAVNVLTRHDIMSVSS